jgi:hypothetical protein
LFGRERTNATVPPEHLNRSFLIAEVAFSGTGAWDAPVAHQRFF